jgi:hypothetical protein
MRCHRWPPRQCRQPAKWKRQWINVLHGKRMLNQIYQSHVLISIYPITRGTWAFACQAEINTKRLLCVSLSPHFYTFFSPRQQSHNDKCCDLPSILHSTLRECESVRWWKKPFALVALECIFCQ